MWGSRSSTRVVVAGARDITRRQRSAADQENDGGARACGGRQACSGCGASRNSAATKAAPSAAGSTVTGAGGMPIALAATQHIAQCSRCIAALRGGSPEPGAEQISVQGFEACCALSACDTDGAIASPSIAKSAIQVNRRRRWRMGITGRSVSAVCARP